MNYAYYRRHLIRKTQCCLPKAINVVLLHPQKVGGKMEFNLKESMHIFSIDRGNSYPSNDGEEHISNYASQMHLFKGPIQVSRLLYMFGQVFQTEVVCCIIHSLALKTALSFNFVVLLVMRPDFHNLINELATKTRQLRLRSIQRTL